MRTPDFTEYPIRNLAGGGGQSPSFGPCVVREAYHTVAGGWADTIAAGPGEVAVCISPGSPSSFAIWRVGPVADMVAYLRSRHTSHGWYDDEVRWAHGMAAKIEAAHVNEQAPIARFATALGVPPERVAEMATLAKVAIEDRA